jgi:uncharacterized protein (DUF697 family)
MKEKIKEEATVDAAKESSSETVDAKAESSEEKVDAKVESLNAPEGREKRLEKLAQNHILASMGVGLIPVPCADLVALMGIQLDLIRKMAAEYGIPFRQDVGKSIIASLMGGFLPVTLGFAAASMIKFIPLIGQTTGAVVMPVMSGASTYAIYKVFMQHFESGGTFLDLDPSKVKAYFSEQFAKGKKVVMNLKTEEPAKEAA